MNKYGPSAFPANSLMSSFFIRCLFLISMFCLLTLPLFPALAQSGLEVGGQAINQGNTQLRVRSGASLSHGRVAWLQPGDTAAVLAGPVRADGYVWWQLDLGGTVGWAAEGSGGTYWLAPYGAPPAENELPNKAESQGETARASDAAPDNANAPAGIDVQNCHNNSYKPGSLKRQLQYGENIRATFTENDISSVHDDGSVWYSHAYWFYGSAKDSISISTDTNLFVLRVCSPIFDSDSINLAWGEARRPSDSDDLEEFLTDFALPFTGIYLIDVQTHDYLGDGLYFTETYTLNFRLEGAKAWQQIAYDETKQIDSSWLPIVGDVTGCEGVFSFDAAAGDLVSVTANIVPGVDLTNNTDWGSRRLRLIQSNSNGEIAHFEETVFDVENESEMEFSDIRIRESGEHSFYIEPVVTPNECDFLSKTGIFPFTVTLTRTGSDKVEVPELESNLPSITVPGTHTGTLPEGDHYHRIQLRLTDSATVSARMTATAGNMVPGLTLWGGGEEAAGDNNEDGVHIAEFENVELDAGLYEFSAWTVRGCGKYKLEVFDGGLPDEAVTGIRFTDPWFLCYGDSRTGVVDSENDTQTYEFPAEAGDVVRIAATVNLGLAPDIALLDDEYDVFAESQRSADGYSAAIESFEIPSIGVYTIRVSNRGGGQSSYDLTLDEVCTLEDSIKPIDEGGCLLPPDYTEGEPPAIPSGTPPVKTARELIEAGVEIADTLALICDVLVTHGASLKGDAVIKNIGSDQFLTADPTILTNMIMEHVAFEIATDTAEEFADEIRQAVTASVKQRIAQYGLDETAAGKDIAELWQNTEEIRQFALLIADLIKEITNRLSKVQRGPCSAITLAFSTERLVDDIRGRLDELANFWTEGGICRIRSEGEIAARNLPSLNAEIVAKVDLRQGTGRLLGTEPHFVGQVGDGPKYYAVLGSKGVDTPLLEDHVAFVMLFVNSLPQFLSVDELAGTGFVWVREDIVKATGNCAKLKQLNLSAFAIPEPGELFQTWVRNSQDNRCVNLNVVHRLYDDWSLQSGSYDVVFETKNRTVTRDYRPYRVTKYSTVRGEIHSYFLQGYKPAADGGIGTYVESWVTEADAFVDTAPKSGWMTSADHLRDVDKEYDC